ncbi:FAD-dependent oxidoreductase, partial [Rhizobium ruizarguesonis]
MRVLVKGAGVAGLTVAYELRSRDAEVTVLDPYDGFRRATKQHA